MMILKSSTHCGRLTVIVSDSSGEEFALLPMAKLDRTPTETLWLSFEDMPPGKSYRVMCSDVRQTLS